MGTMSYIPRPKAGFVKIAGLTIIAISILFVLTSTYSLNSLPPPKYSIPGNSLNTGDEASSDDSSDIPDDIRDDVSNDVSNSHSSIPNLVHYVHIMPDGPDGDIKFGLKHFLSVYSTKFYFNPDTIYLHTDASYASIERARDSPLATAPNKWANLILNLPSVVVNRVSPPEKASGSGVTIKGLEHKSDFVRAEVVYEHGGMYVDFDVYALRDVKPLREAGFANVLGRQKKGQVNSGCWMSQKGSTLMKMWVEGQHEVYDGRWTTHSNDLLTSLADRNSNGGLLTSIGEYLKPGEKEVGNEILILDEKAFAPTSWEVKDATALFEGHPESVGNGTTRDHTPEWEVSYSSSYVLHAFKASGFNKIPYFDPEGITMRYLLAQHSNFARAIYPSVKHAIDAGIISADD
ncbi:hypothetical protein V492_01354 [Pseudogymnoascus sp. VKM F-4246]|nr:hypothetical protein V492_01354 [Pseudogymnoascus sp. VKM F-4246]